jgi:hypothetical protein
VADNILGSGSLFVYRFLVNYISTRDPKSQVDDTGFDTQVPATAFIVSTIFFSKITVMSCLVSVTTLTTVSATKKVKLIILG